jgi:hypothetical protein
VLAQERDELLVRLGHAVGRPGQREHAERLSPLLA